jgi:beta-glucanase (GH16 family)
MGSRTDPTQAQIECLEDRRLLSAAILHADRVVHQPAVHAPIVVHHVHGPRMHRPRIVRRATEVPNATPVGAPVSSTPPKAAPPGGSTPPVSIVPPVASDPPVTVAPPASSDPTPPPLGGNWTNVFDDEFNGSTPASTWVPHQYWSNTATGGEGVEESDPANVSVGNGMLQLTAKPDNTFGTGYTGALVQAGGIQGITTHSPAAFLYGYAEASIKIPAGQGLWPAFWLMPEASITTPVEHDANGEIDIMEMLDNAPGTVYGTVHRHGAQMQNVFRGNTDLSAGWHTFAVDWEPDHITWYVDGQTYGTVTDPSMIPTEAMYPIFDLAVGGSWAGMPDATTPFPATMEVDYVRIWQQTQATTT